MKTYPITIAGLSRDLPIRKINSNLSIALFNLFGDVEITIASAAKLLKLAKDFDIILTPEAKSIPLAYEMARQSGKPYIVARKSAKLYMTNPTTVQVKSITTEAVQNLVICQDDANLLKNKRVLIVDDVISTGESLIAAQSLVQKCGGLVTNCCAVLAEGDAANRTDIIFLEKIPLIFE